MSTFVGLAVLLLFLCSEAAAASNVVVDESKEVYTLYKLDLHEYPLARCLDGSPGSFYHLPAPANSKHPNTWVFYFEGGGWCVNNTACYERSNTHLGSSTKLMSHIGADDINGTMSRKENKNPAFFDANIVFFNYCDGYSFMGSRLPPIELQNNSKIYVRGSYIRKAIMETVVSKFPTFMNATEVLITGCSAGGLATYLHTTSMTNWFKATLPRLQKIKAAPLSGFFLDAENVEGVQSYGIQMRLWFHPANASVDADPNCLAAVPHELQNMCVFAEVVYATQTVPTFVMNSQMDLWQVICILMGGLAGGKNEAMPHCNAHPKYEKCIDNMFTTNHSDACTPDVMRPLINYQLVFRDRLATVKGFSNAGSGIFIISCYTHCENALQQYNTVRVNGVTASEALTSWWNDDDTSAPASKHSYLDCLNSWEAPYFCNPTCSPQVEW